MKDAPTVKLAVLALATGLVIPTVQAQTTDSTAATTTTTVSASTTTASTTFSSTLPPPESTSTNPAGTKLVASFSNWAGSPENASSLINGLRSGKPITLTSSTAPAGTSTTSAATTSATTTSASTSASTSTDTTVATTSGTTGSTTFTPPTKPMGYGNIRIALSLAQQQLASQGITQPTPEQLQAALVGGELTTGTAATGQTTSMPGVLEMRASGMGWGKIANTMGYKLGPVMSGKATVTPIASSGITTAAGTTTTATGAGKGAYGKSDRGIVTAAGSGSGTNVHGKAGSGIVTAAGSAGSGITTGMGHGYSHGHTKVVTASGNGAGMNHGGGHGKGGK